jgi:hypothetical protein
MIHKVHNLIEKVLVFITRRQTPGDNLSSLGMN